MDINSYIQRSKRTLDDIWEIVQRTQRELDEVRTRNRFLEQSNVDLNADITRFRLRTIELQAELDRINGVKPRPEQIYSAGEIALGAGI